MEIPSPPPPAGPLLGRQHLKSPAVTLAVAPLIIGAVTGVAYGQPVRGTLVTLGLLAVAFVARLGFWSFRRDRMHGHEHILTVMWLDELQGHVKAQAAEVDQLRAEVAELRAQTTPQWPAPQPPLTGLASLLRGS
jgi:hypothetical protein